MSIGRAFLTRYREDGDNLFLLPSMKRIYPSPTLERTSLSIASTLRRWASLQRVSKNGAALRKKLRSEKLSMWGSEVDLYTSCRKSERSTSEWTYSWKLKNYFWNFYWESSSTGTVYNIIKKHLEFSGIFLALILIQAARIEAINRIPRPKYRVWSENAPALPYVSLLIDWLLWFFVKFSTK